MDRGRLQRLLWTDEFCDFEDLILVEGGFVELDKSGCGLRQVYLGLTGESLILAQQILPNYKDHPETFYQADLDLELQGLDVKWIIPICFVTMEPVPSEYVIKLETKSGRRYYYQLNTMTTVYQDVWDRWMERLRFIRDDPYGFVENMCKEHGLAFEKDQAPSHGVTIVIDSESGLIENSASNQSNVSKVKSPTTNTPRSNVRRKLTLVGKKTSIPNESQQVKIPTPTGKRASMSNESQEVKKPTAGRRNAVDDRCSFSSLEDEDIFDEPMKKKLDKRSGKSKDGGNIKKSRKQNRAKTKKTKQEVVPAKESSFIKELLNCFRF